MNSDLSGSTKFREIGIEEERQTVIVPLVLNRTDVLVEPEAVIIPSDPVVNIPAELNIEISLRRSQCIRMLALSYDYFYLHESDFNIGLSDNLNSFDEAVSCSDSDYWFTVMQDEIKSMHENDKWEPVDLPDDFKSTDYKWVFKSKRDLSGNV